MIWDLGGNDGFLESNNLKVFFLPAFCGLFHHCSLYYILVSVKLYVTCELINMKHSHVFRVKASLHGNFLYFMPFGIFIFII